MNARQLSYFVFAALLLFVVYDCTYTVEQGSRALLFQFDRVEAAVDSPGLHFKLPVVQRAMHFDARAQTLENEAQNLNTADKISVDVEYFVQWHIDDAQVYYRATGGQTLRATDLLSSIVSRGIDDALSERTLAQLASGDQAPLLSALLADFADKAKGLGIAVSDVRLKSIGFPDSLRDTVYERMRAEQTRVASDLRARGAEDAERVRAQADAQAQVVLADAYRDAEKLRGEGDARASQIYAQAYGQDAEFYRFYRSLDVYRHAFDSRRDVLVLDGKSDVFRYLHPTTGGRQ